jgi:hypothetical protein
VYLLAARLADSVLDGACASVSEKRLVQLRDVSAETLAWIQAAADEQAIMVTWYDEVDWRR